MKSYLLVCCAVLLVSLNVSAASKKEVKYYGQSTETLGLDIIKNETRYTYRDINTTCTRQIPHTSEVCGYETYYRQGPCHWESGDEVCTTEGGGRECHWEAGRTQCRTNSSGREVCRDLPGHQICENKPGRRVCHTTPGRQVCPQESYQQWECHDETTYTTETYACVQTIAEPYIVKRKVNASVDLSFKSLDVSDPKFLVALELEESGKVKITAKNASSKAALMFAKSSIDIDDAGDEDITVKANIEARVVDKATFLAPVTKGIKSVRLSTKEISFIVGKIRNKKMITVSLMIKKKGFIGIGRSKVIDKTLKAADFEITEVDGKSKLTLKGDKFAEAPKAGKKYNVEITVKMDASHKELITPVSGDLKASFSEKLKAK
ncbi:MAG: hypothetical protein ACJAT2_002591 [Bacteriovoracaceae bacterium]|jgi:hypothetical protein